MTDNRTEDERLAITADEYVARKEAEWEADRKVHAEQVRVTRWWSTYNAALNGLYSGSDFDGAAACHEYASYAADRAHGPLEAKP